MSFKKKTIVILTVSLFILSSTHPFILKNAKSSQIDPQEETRFFSESMDLSVAWEFPTSGSITSSPCVLDTNKDGVISQEEFRLHQTQRMQN